jgi:hypothetical protein
MSFSDWFTEQFYIAFSQRYFELNVYLKDNFAFRIIQPVSFSSNFIVDKKRKKAFPIKMETAKFRGSKIILHADLETGYPLELLTEKKIIDNGATIVKTEIVKKLVGKIPKNERKTTLAVVKSPISPDVMYKMWQGRFIEKILEELKSTDWGIVLLAAMVVITILGITIVVAWSAHA